jgi:hypothetical protein
MMEIIRPKNREEVEEINNLVQNGKDIFIMVFLEGCGPCNTTRPEWGKLEGKSFDNNVSVVEMDQTLLPHLDNIGDVTGFPTLKHISNKGNTVEAYEDVEGIDGSRTAGDFNKWIEIKTKKTGGASKTPMGLYRQLMRSLRSRKNKKTKKNQRKNKKNKTKNNKKRTTKTKQKGAKRKT